MNLLSGMEKISFVALMKALQATTSITLHSGEIPLSLTLSLKKFQSTKLSRSKPPQDRDSAIFFTRA